MSAIDNKGLRFLREDRGRPCRRARLGRHAMQASRKAGGPAKRVPMKDSCTWGSLAKGVREQAEPIMK